MRETHYPGLGLTCLEHRLENGLLIRGIRTPGFSRIHGLVLLNYGSADLDFHYQGKDWHTPQGIAHYLEHKTFDLPEGNASAAFSALGASDNAFTTYDRTAYYFDATERAEECLELLLRMVFTPWFTRETVDKEREIIAQEIRMYEDSPGSVAFDMLTERMLERHPMRYPIAGTVESINQIDPENLRLCHDAFYCPSNAVLCVMGDVPFDRIVSVAERNTPKGYREPGRPEYGPTEPVRGGDTLTREMDVSMPGFVLGSRCDDRWDGALERDLAEDLACDLLCGESAPLFSRMYESNLIDGDFYTSYEVVRGISLFTAGGDSPDPERVRELILAEAAQICREGVDAESMERWKRAALGSRIRDLDGFRSTCYRMATYYFEHEEYFDFPEAFQRISAQDVLDVLRCIVPERTMLSVIRPRKEEEL